MLKLTLAVTLIALLLTGCVTSAAQTESTGTQQQTAQATETVTAEGAKTIALEHAGLTAGQVTGLRAERDRDDGRTEWDVALRFDGFEYDYTIDAKTGRILDVDKDRDD